MERVQLTPTSCSGPRPMTPGGTSATAKPQANRSSAETLRAALKMGRPRIGGWEGTLCAPAGVRATQTRPGARLPGSPKGFVLQDQRRAAAWLCNPSPRSPGAPWHKNPTEQASSPASRSTSGSPRQADERAGRLLLFKRASSLFWSPPPPHQATLPLQPFISPTGRAHPLLSFAASHSCHLAQCPRSGTGDDCLRAVLQQGRGSGVWLPSEPILLLCGLD